MTLQVMGHKDIDRFDDRLEGKADVDKDGDIYKPVSRCNYRSFDAVQKVINLSKDKKQIVWYKKLDKTIVIIPLNIIPCCFGTPDGFFAITDKSKPLKYLTTEEH